MRFGPEADFHAFILRRYIGYRFLEQASFIGHATRATASLLLASPEPSRLYFTPADRQRHFNSKTYRLIYLFAFYNNEIPASMHHIFTDEILSRLFDLMMLIKDMIFSPALL